MNNVYDSLRAKLEANPKKWLVTGVAGFIGSHLLEELLALGQYVVGIDNFSDGSPKNLEEVLSFEKTKRGFFQMVEGDLRDISLCNDVCKGIDVILHQAALGSVPRSILEPLKTHASNVDGFINILTAAKDAGVRRFVYASSSSVYGDDPVLPKVENVTGTALSPYALSKWINEEYADLYWRIYGMECLGLRYFNVFGPRQNPNGAYSAVIPRWFSMIRRHEPVVIYGDGENSRDFCFVDNVVQANLLAATTENLDAFGHAFNIACEKGTTLNELFVLIRDIIDKESDLEPTYESSRPGDIRFSVADISKAECLLGYLPTVDLQSGLSRTASWYLQ